MKNKALILSIVWLLVAAAMALSACGYAFPIPTPTATVMDTPVPSATYTPSPTATYTPTPLALADFTAKIEGVAEHGNMACVTYPGSQQDLEGLAITANISQDDEVKDTDVPLEQTGNETCPQAFEMVDGKYDVGKPITLELVLTGDKTVTNTDQKIELGNYFLSPFLRYIYGDSPLSTTHFTKPNPKHIDAYDLSPISSLKYPYGFGHPVFLPSQGIIFQSGLITNIYGQPAHNMWVYLIDVGYFIQLGHMNPQLGVTVNVLEPGTIVGYLGIDPGSDIPHNHTTIRRPLLWGPLGIPSAFQIERNSEFVDMFNPQDQLGGDVLKYGLWLPDTLLASVKTMVDNGFFEPYKP